MRDSSKSGLIAGVLVLTGGLTLAFSPGAGRVPLGTLLLCFGLIAAYRAVRLRATTN